MNRIIKIMLIIFGSISILLGLIGIFIPLLPTTPFLLLGAACYMRGSEKLYHLFIHNKVMGRYIKDYYEGKGIPSIIKVITIGFLWTGIIFSMFFVVSNTLLQFLLLIIAIGVTWHIHSIKGAK